eukprot:6483585-Amphidinium_carterae.1
MHHCNLCRTAHLTTFAFHFTVGRLRFGSFAVLLRLTGWKVAKNYSDPSHEGPFPKGGHILRHAHVQILTNGPIAQFTIRFKRVDLPSMIHGTLAVRSPSVVESQPDHTSA